MKMLASAPRHAARKDDWRLYLVTPLVDQRSGIYANLVIFDAMMKHAEFETLRRRLEIVGRHNPYAEWLHHMKPVGLKNVPDDLEIESNPAEDGIIAAYIYLSQ